MVPVLIVSNPVSGDGQGSQFVQEHVIPLLPREHVLASTTHPGHAGEVALAFIRDHSSATFLDIIVSGGDGTLREILDALVPDHNQTIVRFALVPQGTANALYSSRFPPKSGEEVIAPAYKLQSLRALLNSSGREISVFETRIFDATCNVVYRKLGAVVASTAFHASILDRADELRHAVTGLERFKRAAADTITTWYYGDCRLLSARLYNPATSQWAERQDEVILSGPYQYFLSTVNVDRLEPRFRITPLALSALAGDMDVIIIRPVSSPSFSAESDSKEQRIAFIPTVSAALGGAYQDGAHIELRYCSDGRTSPSGDSNYVVEYYQCHSWEWRPSSDDIPSRLVCVDGLIVTIPEGGKARTTLLDVKNFVICC